MTEYQTLRYQTPDGFFKWRNRLNLQQSDAAILLGLSLRTITYYEGGDRGIKLPVAIACYAYENWPHLRARIPEILARGESA